MSNHFLFKWIIKKLPIQVQWCFLVAHDILELCYALAPILLSSSSCIWGKQKQISHGLLRDQMWYYRSFVFSCSQCLPYYLSSLAFTSTAKVSKIGVIASLAVFSVSSSAPAIIIVSSRVNSPPFPACKTIKKKMCNCESKLHIGNQVLDAPG